MIVAEIMTQPVISVTPETMVAEAARLMLQHRVSGLPVVNRRGEVVGVVTEGDLLRRAETGTERRRARWLEFLTVPGRLAQDYALAHARKVGDVMTVDVVAVAPETPLQEVVRLMERRQVKRLPVVETGRLVGIISRANLVRAFLHSLPKAEAKPIVPDSDIRERILSEVAKQPWGRQARIDVRVKGGVVELHGSITDERARTALQVLAENVAGVKAVRHHFVWVGALPAS